MLEVSKIKIRDVLTLGALRAYVTQMQIIINIKHADDIVLEELDMPKASKGWVLVKILAFGMNHSELVLRVNEIRADYISKIPPKWLFFDIK